MTCLPTSNAKLTNATSSCCPPSTLQSARSSSPSCSALPNHKASRRAFIRASSREGSSGSRLMTGPWRCSSRRRGGAALACAALALAASGVPAQAAPADARIVSEQRIDARLRELTVAAPALGAEDEGPGTASGRLPGRRQPPLPGPLPAARRRRRRDRLDRRRRGRAGDRRQAGDRRDAGRRQGGLVHRLVERRRRRASGLGALPRPGADPADRSALPYGRGAARASDRGALDGRVRCVQLRGTAPGHVHGGSELLGRRRSQRRAARRADRIDRGRRLALARRLRRRHRRDPVRRLRRTRTSSGAPTTRSTWRRTSTA